MKIEKLLSDQWITTTETKYLTAEQSKKAKELSGHDTASALVVRYRASRDHEKQVEYAYTDTHKVRTHTETLFVIVDSTGKIRHFEVLAFEEPLEYMPKDLWYGKFKNAQLNPDLEVKRQIPFVTGASLTTQASTQAARRILAIHQVLQQKVAEK
jgi:Na+-translocating ferredoxin:NAD+ oxidoreductase subunit G